MTDLIHILYVDDSPHDRELVRDALEHESGGFQVTEAASRAAFEARLAEGQYDLVLSDFNILGFEGLQVIETVQAMKPGVPVVIVTGTGSEEVAVEAMKRGAADYVIKSPQHIRRLPLTIRSVLESKHTDDERSRLKLERDRLFDYSIDLLCVCSFDGYFAQLNPAWHKTLGWTDAELSAQPLLHFVHSDDREATARALARLAQDKQALSFENRFHCHDGSYRWLAWNAYPLEQDQLIFAVARDDTARRHAKDEIERQLQRLAALRQIDQAIASTFNLRLILDVLVEQAAMQLRVDGASILLYNAANLSLEQAAGYGLHTPAQRKRGLLSEGLAGQAARERRIIHVPNLLAGSDRLARALQAEGETAVAYYGVPLTAKGEIKGVLEIYQRGALDTAPEWLEFLQALAGEAAIAVDNVQLFEDLQRSNLDLAVAYDATIEGWSRALELRDKETEGHSARVTELTVRLARASGVREDAILQLRRGALLHDIGKMGVPDHILLKAGPLSEDEWAIMRQHPAFAFEMLSPIQYLRPALEIPYCHHEKWDGSGYPRGLAGANIPLAARIFAVVDVWDALCSDRPYRPAWSAGRVRDYIQAQAGQHFDPRAVAAFEGLQRSRHA